MMTSFLRWIRNLLMVTVLLTKCCGYSMGHPTNFLQDKMERLSPPPIESDDTLWIVNDGLQPLYPHLRPSLMSPQNRNEITDQLEDNTYFTEGETRSFSNGMGYHKRSSLSKRSGHRLHKLLRHYPSKDGAIISMKSRASTWPKAVSKRGIGLFSLAVALAQNSNSPAPSKPRMQPVDLTAYPRRARFFVATMG